MKTLLKERFYETDRSIVQDSQTQPKGERDGLTGLCYVITASQTSSLLLELSCLRENNNLLSTTGVVFKKCINLSVLQKRKQIFFLSFFFFLLLHNNQYCQSVLFCSLSLTIRAYLLICLKLGQIQYQTIGTNLFSTPLRSGHFQSRKAEPFNDVTQQCSTGSKVGYHGWLLLLGEFRKAECNLPIQNLASRQESNTPTLVKIARNL